MSMARAVSQCVSTPSSWRYLGGGEKNVGIRKGSAIRPRGTAGRITSRRATQAEAVGEIEEMQASLPFTREMWATFMREYWQKRPVVIRGALPAEAAMPIDADELAGLACESEFQPRVINKGAGGPADWSLELGPFTEQELQALPSDGSWCVILNDLEKHVPDLATFLDLFDHFPKWRVADVQASLSGDRGGVGAHSDQFDVFLVQGEGCKQWSISADPEYAPENDDAFFPDAQVRVLRDFHPTTQSLLKPGDVLYLPPKVAHHGVAEADEGVCVTYSVGFLAPTHDELVLSYAQASADGRTRVKRWSDPWLEPQEAVGKISPSAVTHATEIIRNANPKNEADIARWFGCHVTASHGFDGDGFVPDEILSADELLAIWTEEGVMFRRADVRFAFADEVSDGSLEGCLFFAAGDVWELRSPRGMEFARHVANFDDVVAEDWVERIGAEEFDVDEEIKALLLDLFSIGYLFLEDVK